MEKYVELVGFKMWNFNYEEYRSKYKLNKPEIYGMCLIFSEWLKFNSPFCFEESGEDVLNNTSSLRNGNRLDLMDNYFLDLDGRYQIDYIWALKNGIVYATVYDSWNDSYVGHIEISC